MLYKILNHIKAMTKSQWEMVRICWSHMLDPRHYILITKLFIWKPSITFLSLPQTSSVYESFVQIITYSLNSILLSFVSRTKPPRRFWSKALLNMCSTNFLALLFHHHLPPWLSLLSLLLTSPYGTKGVVTRQLQY